MSPHAYTEDQLVEQPAIGLFLQRVPLCKGCLHHSLQSPTAGWMFGDAAEFHAWEGHHD